MNEIIGNITPMPSYIVGNMSDSILSNISRVPYLPPADLMPEPFVSGPDMIIYIALANATIHLPRVLEPVVHAIFAVLDWLGGIQ